MPSIFKALASITVWILFIFGCLSLVGGLVRTVGAGVLGSPELTLVSAYFGFGIVSLVLCVVTMKLRQTLQ